MNAAVTAMPIATRHPLLPVLLVLLLGAGHVRANNNPIRVPRQMDFCGHHLHFTGDARDKLQKLVNDLTKNHVYYNLMADKAATYMPFIEDGLAAAGAPEDLKYIAIQESGLRGGVVSSSDAVGFWQLKDFTAREVGLQVSNDIDERKHIFRASVGAGRYFKTNHGRYNNWVYAIISYYAGGTGAKPYTKKRYIGAREMEIDDDLHWYAMKAIAHKIAYEPGLKRYRPDPSLRLVPHSNHGELRVKNLVESSGLSEEKFHKYNLWIDTKRLPDDEPFSYYVPGEVHNELALMDPHRKLFEPAGKPLLASGQAGTSDKPKRPASDGRRNRPREEALPISKRSRVNLPANTREVPLSKAPQLGQTFLRVKPRQTIEQIAGTHDLKAKRLRRWNDIQDGLQPKPGMHLILVRPRKAEVHIARPWETLVEIAARYRRNPRRLARLNRMESTAQLLVGGQKIYLKDKRPTDEPVIIYSNPGKQPDPWGLMDQIAAKQTSSTESAPGPKENPETPEEAATTPDNEPDEPEKTPSAKQTSSSDPTSGPKENPETPEEAAKTPADEPDKPEKAPSAKQTSSSDPTPGPKENPETPEEVTTTPADQPEKATSTKQTSSSESAPGPKENPETPEEAAPEPAQNQSEKTPEAASGHSSGDSSATGPATHTVQAGETLYQLSRRYELSVEKLQQLNGLDGYTIQPGQVLKLRVD